MGSTGIYVLQSQGALKRNQSLGTRIVEEINYKVLN